MMKAFSTIPKNSGHNPYSTNFKIMLEREYGLTYVDWKMTLFKFSRSKILYIHWLENYYKNYIIIASYLFIILVFWITGGTVHRIVHNRQQPGRLLKPLMCLYDRYIFSKVFCHGYATSKRLGYTYLRHPRLYQLERIKFLKPIKDNHQVVALAIPGRFAKYKQNTAKIESISKRVVSHYPDKQIIFNWIGDHSEREFVKIQEIPQSNHVSNRVVYARNEEEFIREIIKCDGLLVLTDGSRSIVSGNVFLALELGIECFVFDQLMFDEIRPSGVLL